MSVPEKYPPTASELAILHLLWERGPLPVREVHDELAKQKAVVYTTVLKTMQVMHERGFLDRESQGRKHIYRATVAKEDTQDKLLDTFLDRTSGGSAKDLVMRALGKYKTSKEDIEELKSLIERLEKDGEDD